MNLLLFTADEIARPLPRSDPRAGHLLTVLRRGIGDSFDAGVVNGPRGKGTVTKMSAEALELSFQWTIAPPPPDKIALIIGLPRPQTARDILRDATTLGVSAMHFVSTEKSERSYAQSSLWTSGEWRRLVTAGAEQAFCTLLPAITHGSDLRAVVAQLAPGSVRVALDNYEGAAPLGKLRVPAESEAVIAIGPERGWTAGDRACLREHGFALAHLGERVLRTETAVIAALTLVKSARGSL